MQYPFPPAIPLQPHVWMLVVFAVLMIPLWAYSLQLFRRKLAMSTTERSRNWCYAVGIPFLLAYFCGVGTGEKVLSSEDKQGVLSMALVAAGTSIAVAAFSFFLQCAEVRPTLLKILPIAVGCYFVLGVTFSLYDWKVYGKHRAGPKTFCINNMKLIGLAIHNWNDQYERLPDSTMQKDFGPPYSWRVGLLPFLDQGALAEKYNYHEPWDSPANLPVAQTDVRTLRCPSSKNVSDSMGRFFSSYSLVTGPQTAFEGGIGLRMDQIKDGKSKTALMVESCGRPIVWTEPRDVDVSGELIGVNQPGRKPGTSESVVSSYHRSGANMLMADGSIYIAADNIDPKVLRALLTANGNDNEAIKDRN